MLILLAAVLTAPAAWAQEPTASPTVSPSPTATPTPEPTPTPEEIEEAKRKERLRKRKIVRRVYADYQRDGRIDNCDHSRAALKRTLESITDKFNTDFPDFREAVKAAIKDHDKERCEEEQAAAEETPTPTPTPTATPTPAPTSSPPVATTPPPASTDSGDLPNLDSGAGGSGGGRNGGGSSPAPETTPPTESDVAPVQPQGTPAPTVVPPTTEPQLAVVSPDGDSNLLLPALLLAAALAGLGLLGASALAARRSGRLAGWGHSLREASYRASGAWGDFGDWLRLGR
jgi:hypothetical protein